MHSRAQTDTNATFLNFPKPNLFGFFFFSFLKIAKRVHSAVSRRSQASVPGAGTPQASGLGRMERAGETSRAEAGGGARAPPRTTRPGSRPPRPLCRPRPCPLLTAPHSGGSADARGLAPVTRGGARRVPGCPAPSSPPLRRQRAAPRGRRDKPETGQSAPKRRRPRAPAANAGLSG